MEIKFVHKLIQNENTPEEDRQYGDVVWCVHADRSKVGERSFRDVLLRLEEELKEKIVRGFPIEFGIYLYDIQPMYYEVEEKHNMAIFYRWDYIWKEGYAKKDYIRD